MIEETVANYISTNAATYAVGEVVPGDGTMWTQGVDIFLHHFPEGNEQGIIVRYGNNNITWHALSKTNLKIIVAWYDYVTARNKLATIINMMNDNRGSLDGSWSVTNDIYIEELGRDEEGRYTFVIETETKYDYSEL